MARALRALSFQDSFRSEKRYPGSATQTSMGAQQSAAETCCSCRHSEENLSKPAVVNADIQQQEKLAAFDKEVKQALPEISRYSNSQMQSGFISSTMNHTNRRPRYSMSNQYECVQIPLQATTTNPSNFRMVWCNNV